MLSAGVVLAPTTSSSWIGPPSSRSCRDLTWRFTKEIRAHSLPSKPVYTVLYWISNVRGPLLAYLLRGSYTSRKTLTCGTSRGPSVQNRLKKSSRKLPSREMVFMVSTLKATKTPHHDSKPKHWHNAMPKQTGGAILPDLALCQTTSSSPPPLCLPMLPTEDLCLWRRPREQCVRYVGTKLSRGSRHYQYKVN